jgi:hypothetical protein
MIVYVSNVGIISVLRYNQVSVSSRKGGLFLLSRELCTWQTENVNWSTYVPTKNKRKGPFLKINDDNYKLIDQYYISP